VGVQPDDEPSVQALHQLLLETRGQILARKRLNNRLCGIAKSAGGLRTVAEHLHLTAPTIFPFYLAILAQTGANPMALRLLRRDCVHSHPLASHLERMVWDKPRSAREQYVDFPVAKHWSAPNLVRRLIDLNDKIVPSAHDTDRQLLFLIQASAASPAAALSWGSVHLQLNKFIIKHGLPNFDLAGFRAHVAKAHHVQGASLQAAQERLNHTDAGTTIKYTPLGDRAIDHDRKMIEFQGRLVREAREQQTRWHKADSAESAGVHETLFGFRCSNPFEGRAPGSVAGKLCLQFSKCATCPGALVPLDDVRVVAKLVATLRHLDATGARAKSEGWWDRYHVVYEPTRLVLSKELLPAVSDAVLAKAEELVSLEILPHLE
jgi:hypothetical protein